MANEKIFEEFLALSSVLSQPRGITKVVHIISNWLSPKITTMIQRSGIQKSIISKNTDKLILNIGCLTHIDPSCINTDLFPSIGKLIRIIRGLEKIEFDYFLNILHKDKNLINKADGIIFSHVLEHIPSHLTLTILENLYAFLKPGGFMRISVPNLEKYFEHELPSNQEVSTPVIARNSLIYRWNHVFMFDQALLTNLLEHTGFKDIQLTEYQKGALGNFDESSKDGETLYLICKK